VQGRFRAWLDTLGDEERADWKRNAERATAQRDEFKVERDAARKERESWRDLAREHKDALDAARCQLEAVREALALLLEASAEVVRLPEVIELLKWYVKSTAKLHWTGTWLERRQAAEALLAETEERKE